MLKKISVYALLLCLCALLLPPFSWGELPISSIFSEGSESVVLIGAAADKDHPIIGSGFVIHPDGLIVTNYHVVKNSRAIFVKFKNSKHYSAARMVNSDPEKDIAIIKINNAGLKAVTMGNSNNIKIGEKVVAIGNPLGLESTVADGLISAMRTVENGRKLLQTSVPLSTGSSGSPLFNLNGEVIGVNMSGRTDGQNLNFAVPINSVRSLMLSAGYSDPEKNTGFELYTVKPKDTLYNIAKIFNTTSVKIMKLNNLPDSKIIAGKQLKIPTNR